MSDRISIPHFSRRKLLGFATLAAALPWALPAAAEIRPLVGTVSYRERIAVPKYAILEVSLIDTSIADKDAQIIASGQMRTRGQMPIPYRLRINNKRIVRGHAYALQARILVDGKLWFINKTLQPVKPQPIQAEIVVERVAEDTSEAALPAGKWLAESIRGAGVIDNLQSTVEIAKDGTVTGKGGCNGFGGKATITGDKIAFGTLVATQMACAPAISDQEMKFLAALHDATRWLIDEARGKLILFDAKNREILVLARMT